ncbi:biotin transporter BioY [Caloranaerobacter sp. TR13]|uniref:biotin transporter BioY n=1 Tax=Caloranaerobacter sp. TR13 TaxID=1302151 RepID=UPI001379132F|nr:biotin transporter BioY [Caloranaerobacter sp. TR13]
MSTRNLVFSAMFAALTAVCAQIFINLPFTPIPVTLQVLAVFLSGIILGSRIGALSQLVYLFIGAIGIPVFASFSGGLQVLVGYTGGFLIAFPIASFVIGKIVNSFSKTSPKLNLAVNTLAMLAGLIIIYLMGAAQYAIVAKVSFINSLSVTVLPFIFADLLKLIAAVLIAEPVKKALKNAKLI